MDPRGAALLSDFVLDASATMVLVMDDEPEEPVMPIVRALGAGAAVVPELWHFEVANALASARRRGRADDAGLATAIGLIEGLHPVRDSGCPPLGALVALADHHRITPYDASYLDIALRRGIPLASVDHELRRAASAAGVPLVC